MRYLITFSYDGTNYNGYQRQPNVKTIEDEIEKVLYKINGNNAVIIHATGRTDAHVHAINQKAHFDLLLEIPNSNLKKAMNSLLPGDIYIKNVEKVSSEFHARYNIVSKEYMYIINTGEYNPLERNYVYQYNKKLNVEEMKKAIKNFNGEHNFKSFTKTDDKREDYVRKIFSSSILLEDNYIKIIFKGNGFLRYMVRNMVGALIAVGENIKTPEDIVKILRMEDRKYACKTAPPEGLYLRDVFY